MAAPQVNEMSRQAELDDVREFGKAGGAKVVPSRGDGEEEPELDIKAFSRKVEQLGAEQLRGLAKKLPRKGGDIQAKIAHKARIQRQQKMPKIPIAPIAGLERIPPHWPLIKNHNV